MTSGNVAAETNRFSYHIIIRIVIVLIYLIITAVAAYVIFTRIRQSVAASDLLPDITIDRSEDSESPNVERVEGENLPVWTSTDRITALILGIDERAQAEDFWRTDTMILATLDPVTMRVGVLSIPRDLWVHIPGYTENRINTAHMLGQVFHRDINRKNVLFVSLFLTFSKWTTICFPVTLLIVFRNTQHAVFKYNGLKNSIAILLIHKGRLLVASVAELFVFTRLFIKV